ncbi:MAG: ABC transporter permease [Candidatus Synoicihabitans palmerolidicus]|nr:ABC transporter permease [Candidatus Synoicihabitans palmerolidicus]
MFTPNYTRRFCAETRKFSRIRPLYFYATYSSPTFCACWTRSSLVTGGLFEALDAKPQLGRIFATDEFSFSAHRTIILSDAAWEQYFNRRSDILNSTILIDDQPHTIVGIMPPSFREPAVVDAWLPFPAESPEYFARDSR